MTDENSLSADLVSDASQELDSQQAERLIMLPPKAGYTGGLPPADHTEKLAALAREIVATHKQSDELMINAAKKLFEARKLIEKTKGVTWKAWCEKNLQLKESRIRDLLAIGKSPQPHQVLQKQREDAADRQKRMREERKAAQEAKAKADLDAKAELEVKAAAHDGKPDTAAEALQKPPLHHGGPAPEIEPERDELAYWAEHAGIDAVKEVLAQAMKLDPTPFNLT